MKFTPWILTIADPLWDVISFSGKVNSQSFTFFVEISLKFILAQATCHSHLATHSHGYPSNRMMGLALQIMWVPVNYIGIGSGREVRRVRITDLYI
jgi:hypothetical protein